jgi:hypothetical protein
METPAFIISSQRWLAAIIIGAQRWFQKRAAVMIG